MDEGRCICLIQRKTPGHSKPGALQNDAPPVQQPDLIPRNSRFQPENRAIETGQLGLIEQDPRCLHMQDRDISSKMISFRAR
jgi:hypothetical protein